MTLGAVLLDSGATHCLHQPRSEKGLAIDTQAQAATGTSWGKQAASGPRSWKDVQELIPIGLLARMGVTMAWQRDAVHLRHPRSLDAAGFDSADFSFCPDPFFPFELDQSLPLELDPSPFCPFPFRFGVVGGKVDPV